MAWSIAANTGGSSQQTDGEGAPRPSEDAAAAWGSGRARPTSDAWGTGTRLPVDDAVVETWGTRPSTDARFTDSWASLVTTEPRVTGGTWGPWSSAAQGAGSWRSWPSEAARENWSGWAPERRPSTVPWPSEHAVITNVTVEDARALHCGVCGLPLKPPIFEVQHTHTHTSILPSAIDNTFLTWRCFQCDLGQAVCSACRGPGYRRCRAMENLVATVRVPCPNAAHGCDATPAYYDMHAHGLACAHAPGTRCPADACEFVGSMAALLDHFTAVHGWTLTTEDGVGKSFDVDLQDGFNVVTTAVRDGGNQLLLLLNVVSHPFGRTIAAVCISPYPAAVESWSSAAASKTVQLELRYSAASHYQESEFNVPFADIADGFPDVSELAQFVVPKSVHSDDHATTLVTAYITIK
uniref:E3 ubiquitin-protein ligase n=1 Tax=Aegilops tauschii TaxID=37682 RepID=M8ATN2_AEGTA